MFLIPYCSGCRPLRFFPMRYTADGFPTPKSCFNSLGELFSSWHATCNLRLSKCQGELKPRKWAAAWTSVIAGFVRYVPGSTPALYRTWAKNLPQSLSVNLLLPCGHSCTVDLLLHLNFIFCCSSFSNEIQMWSVVYVYTEVRRSRPLDDGYICDAHTINIFPGLQYLLCGVSSLCCCTRTPPPLVPAS